MTTTGEDFIMSMDDVELKEQKRAEKLAKLESGELVYIKYVGIEPGPLITSDSKSNRPGFYSH